MAAAVAALALSGAAVGAGGFPRRCWMRRTTGLCGRSLAHRSRAAEPSPPTRPCERPAFRAACRRFPPIPLYPANYLVCGAVCVCARRPVGPAGSRQRASFALLASSLARSCSCTAPARVPVTPPWTPPVHRFYSAGVLCAGTSTSGPTTPTSSSSAPDRGLARY